MWFDPKPVWEQTCLGTKDLVKFGPKSTFLHPSHLSGREMTRIQPLTHTLDPKLIIFSCRSANTYVWKPVTSDVHFRKGALIPSLLAGLGWVRFVNWGINSLFLGGAWLGVICEMRAVRMHVWPAHCQQIQRTARAMQAT